MKSPRQARLWVSKSHPPVSHARRFCIEPLETRRLLSTVPTFGTASLLPAGFDPISAAIGDFNGDGKADMAVVQRNAPLEVFLGNGDGTFQSPVDYSVGPNGAGGAESVAVGEFYGDGKEDLVVISPGWGDVEILRGNGDGTFQRALAVNVGDAVTIATTQVAVGDFRSDGIDDLVLVTGNSSAVLLGNGDGTFQSQVLYGMPWGGCDSVAVGDFYGDGKEDIAATSSVWSVATGAFREVSKLSIFRGNGDGTFQSPVIIPTNATVLSSVVVGDFTGDGQSDLVFISFFLHSDQITYSTTVSILPSNGDGTFQNEVDYPTTVPQSDPVWLAAGDLNGDGKSDLVVIGYVGTTVGIELNTTGGNVAVATPETQTAASAVSETIDLGNATLSNLSGPIMLDVNWGDGSAQSQITVTPAGVTGAIRPALAGDAATSAAIPLSASHAFSNSGNDTVTVSIDSAFTNDEAQLAQFTVAVATQQPVYRLYSPVTLEHLYTSDSNEYTTLKQEVGTWNDEGTAYQDYTGPATVDGVTDEPLYRLYNPTVRQHLWTTDLNEYTTLATAGWNQEGIAGYVFPATVAGIAAAPLYRLMAPNVHLWTTALNEYDTLQTEGWTGEGIIGYVL